MNSLNMLAWLKAHKTARGVLTKLSQGVGLDKAAKDELARGGCPLKLRQLNGWTQTPSYVLDSEEDRTMLAALLRLTSNLR